MLSPYIDVERRYLARFLTAILFFWRSSTCCVLALSSRRHLSILLHLPWDFLPVWGCRPVWRYAGGILQYTVGCGPITNARRDENPNYPWLPACDKALG
ncbi:hypothetical protein F4803DRAFT_500391 [Xylaria telfairii]|nr:hypothetical protein F4803DRAFT_500391 [Xylaria telfairii]